MKHHFLYKNYAVPTTFFDAYVPFFSAVTNVKCQQQQDTITVRISSTECIVIFHVKSQIN